MIYGYARVTDKILPRKANSLEEQVKLLKAAGAQEISSDSIDGKKLVNTQLLKLLDRLAPGDRLIVTRLDCFSRKAVECWQMIKSLREKDVEVHVLNIGLADNSPDGKLIAKAIEAFAAMERDVLVERTQTGRKEAAKKSKHAGGRPPKFTPSQIEHAMNLLESGNSYSQVQHLTGISKSTLIREHRKLYLG